MCDHRLSLCCSLQRKGTCLQVHDCTKQYSHCYKHCPFAHKNEYAKRRSTKLHAYSCIMCPDQDALNNGKTSNSWGYASKCHRGDTCAYSHSNLERHLHPDMYRSGSSAAEHHFLSMLRHSDLDFAGRQVSGSIHSNLSSIYASNSAQ